MEKLTKIDRKMEKIKALREDVGLNNLKEIRKHIDIDNLMGDIRKKERDLSKS